MTPENRARLHAVLRESLARAVLPSSPQGKDRAALGPFAGPPRAFAATSAALVERFRREAEALTVRVSPVKDEEEATAAVMAVLKANEAKTVLAWAFSAIGLPPLPGALHAAGIACVPQDVPSDPQARRERLAELAAAPVGLTGAAAGLADTGSLALVHGPARGRLASLLPPVHVAVLRRSAIVLSFADLLERQPAVAEASSNLVLVSGPSRTADIEQVLTRGVHGPREVHIVLL